MLTFADNAWHVVANSIILIAGLSIAISQKRIFSVPQVKAIALYFWHCFFCIFYFWYSLGNSADSTKYYLHSFDYAGGFDLGTAGVYYFISPFTQILNLSYGSVFLIFNIVGYIGLLAFASTLQSVTKNSSQQIKKFSTLILFLPSISFWSSAIGKDALTFMGAGLASWAVLDIKNRGTFLILSILLFLLPRPHMAGILILSLSFSLLFTSPIGLIKKIIILIIAAPISILIVNFGLTYAGLDDIGNLGGVVDYIETRQSYNLNGGSSVDISNLSLPLRLFTYLFRPLLFDAKGALYLIVSLENMAILSLFLFVLFRPKRTRSVLGKFEISFFLLFGFISWIVLANTTANLGISVRQKWMFLPMLIALAFSYLHRKPSPTILSGKFE